MLLRVTKVFKVKIKAVSHISTKKDPNIVITHLHVDLFDEQALEQLEVSPYQISSTMNPEPLYALFKMPKESTLGAFVGQEGYAEILEGLQLNNTVTRNIKRFLSEQEYNKLLHLNNQPSPARVSDEELAILKQQTLEQAEQTKVAKEKRKQEETSKPKAKPKQKASSKAVRAFAALMQNQKTKKHKKQLTFKGNLIDGYVEKGPLPSFERLLENHNKYHTKAGVVGSYMILQAKKECQHKNGVSIKNFR